MKGKSEDDRCNNQEGTRKKILKTHETKQKLKITCRRNKEVHLTEEKWGKKNKKSNWRRGR